PRLHAAAGRAGEGRKLHRVVVSARRGAAAAECNRAVHCRRTPQQPRHAQTGSRQGGRVMARCLAIAVLLSLAPAAPARTWTVGGTGADFPFIAPAIAAASAGDEIHVRGGVYREDLVVDKPLTIVGDGRPTLFGTGVGSVVTLLADGVELR